MRSGEAGEGGEPSTLQTRLEDDEQGCAQHADARTGIALIAALERTGILALWAKQSSVVLEPLTANHLIDTALLCCLDPLGEAPQFGAGAGETLELWFSSPSRSPLSLCIGAATVGDRLHLTFRYPHRLFGREGARRFADCYLVQLRNVVAAARA